MKRERRKFSSPIMKKIPFFILISLFLVGCDWDSKNGSLQQPEEKEESQILESGSILDPLYSYPIQFFHVLPQKFKYRLMSYEKQLPLPLDSRFMVQMKVKKIHVRLRFNSYLLKYNYSINENGKITGFQYIGEEDENSSSFQIQVPDSVCGELYYDNPSFMLGCEKRKTDSSSTRQAFYFKSDSLNTWVASFGIEATNRGNYIIEERFENWGASHFINYEWGEGLLHSTLQFIGRRANRSGFKYNDSNYLIRINYDHDEAEWGVGRFKSHYDFEYDSLDRISLIKAEGGRNSWSLSHWEGFEGEIKLNYTTTGLLEKMRYYYINSRGSYSGTFEFTYEFR